MNSFFLMGYNYSDMRKARFLLTPLIVSLFLGWGGISAGASQQATVENERGRKMYEKYCVECHGEKGHGDGPRAPLLAPRPGNLVSAATSSKSDAELLQIITYGVPRTAMRGWKDELSEEDRLKVLAFIRSLVRFQEPSLTPPPPQ